MSAVASSYRVVLMPAMEVVESGLSLREAQVWVQTYNQIMQSPQRQAVIAEEQAAQRAA